MFTGIIREIGTVARIERARGVVRLAITAPVTSTQVQPLESVAINGVCLSVVAVERSVLWFEMIPETQQLTTLVTLRSGTRVNIEPSLLLTDRLSGHLVFGHVDGVGTVQRRRQLSGELIFEIRVPAVLVKCIVPKGPVTLDGVSLTVGRVIRRSTITAHLIPETLRRSTLGERQVKDQVNLELDYFAKLIRQFVHPHTRTP